MSPGIDRALVRDPIHEADVVAHPNRDERDYQDDQEVMHVLFHRLTLRSKFARGAFEKLAGSQLQVRPALAAAVISRKAKNKKAVYDHP